MTKSDIQLQADASPVVQHLRVIPYAKRTKVQQMLEKLQQQGIYNTSRD